MESSLRLDVIDPTADRRWDEFIMANPRSTIFHHSSWARVLRDRYGHPPECYVLKNENDEIAGGAPFLFIPSRLVGKRISCLPCSEYCFPLAESSEGLSRLLSSAKSEVDSGRASYLEIKGWKDTITAQEFALEEHPNYLRHVTSLDSHPETLKASIIRENYHLRRNLKRAETSGISLREPSSEDDIRQFHQLNTAARRRLNLLPWPYRFLRSIYEHMVESGHGFMLIAEWQGRMIAGGLFFCFKDTIMLRINWYDQRYSQFRPSYLVIWKAMERACQEGYKFFDFGLSDTDNPGLIAFKRQWGSQETVVPFYYYYPPARRVRMPSRTSRRFRQAYFMMNRLLPTYLAELVGKLLYRHLG
jgi:CelD/BcsL family acetyltransferase involved in cellulose biosynthesis